MSKPTTLGVLRRIVIRGGSGSGHFGHKGRPGERGGSQPGEGGDERPVKSGRGLMFHGTSMGAARKILKQGLRMRQAGIYTSSYAEPRIWTTGSKLQAKHYAASRLDSHRQLAAVVVIDLTKVPFKPMADFTVASDEPRRERIMTFDRDVPPSAIVRVETYRVIGWTDAKGYSFEQVGVIEKSETSSLVYVPLIMSEDGEEYYPVPIDGLTERGGPGSGHFGHEGRPGQRGGSQPGEGGGQDETRYKVEGQPPPKLNIVTTGEITYFGGRGTGEPEGRHVGPLPEHYQEEYRKGVERAVGRFTEHFGYYPDNVTITNDTREFLAGQMLTQTQQATEMGTLEGSTLGAYGETNGKIWMQDFRQDAFLPDTVRWHQGVLHELGHWSTHQIFNAPEVLAADAHFGLMDVPDSARTYLDALGYEAGSHWSEYAADLIEGFVSFQSGLGPEDAKGPVFSRDRDRPWDKADVQNFQHMTRMMAERQQARREAPAGEPLRQRAEQAEVLVIYELAGEAFIRPASKAPEAVPGKVKVMPLSGIVERYGTASSGHRGHKGRPGQRGGSQPGEGGDDERRYYKVANKVSSLASRIRSKGGRVMVSPSDIAAVRSWVIARLEKRNPGPSAEHHNQRQLRTIMSEVRQTWEAAGGPMEERYAVPMLESYERLLDEGKFGSEPPMLWLRDKITAEEALKAQQDHPRSAKWIVRDDFQARYLSYLDAIVFIPYESFSSDEEFTFNQFSEWLSNPPVPMDAKGIDAPTFVDMHYANRIDGTLLHEYGHARDWQAEGKDAPQSGAPLMSRPDLMREHISFYSGEAPSEAVAETYALLQHPDYDKATPEAKAIVEYVWKHGPLPEGFR